MPFQINVCTIYKTCVRIISTIFLAIIPCPLFVSVLEEESQGKSHGKFHGESYQEATRKCPLHTYKSTSCPYLLVTPIPTSVRQYLQGSVQKSDGKSDGTCRTSKGKFYYYQYLFIISH